MKARVPLEFHSSRRKYAFFISHVGEDSAEASQLKNEIANISSRGGRPPLDSFLDVYNWPLGNDIRVAIRENLRQSQYMIAWITPEFVKTKRGWIWFEMAYAELQEETLNDPSPSLKYPFIIPVFQGVKFRQVERTPLLRYWERSLLTPLGRPNPIDQIAGKLVDFYDQEARRRGGVSR